MSWQPPRGTRDLLPKDMKLRNDLYDKFRKIFELYGFGQVETPAFEDFALLSKKSGPEIKDEIYYFKDKSDRELGLRFDPTVPIARIVASDKSLPKPIKFSYITRMWRYDRPGAGRWREFWQAGCELIGSPAGMADVEILQLASDLLKTAGVKDFYIKVGSRSLLNRVMTYIGVNENNRNDIIRSLDKLSKIGKNGVIKELIEKKIDKKVIEKIFDVLEGKTKELEVEIKKWDEFIQLRNTVESLLKNDVKIELDFMIVRGIDYYTGFVFETFIRGKESMGSVCSGGRYDNLIKTYGGEDLPAVGFGLGIDRLLDAIEAKPEEDPVDVFVASVDDAQRKEVADISRYLRGEGVSCEYDLNSKDFSKQIKYASSKKIPVVLIVGSEELKNNQVRIKDMRTGKEKLVKNSDSLKELKALITKS